MFLEKKNFLDLIGPRFNRAGVRALRFDIEIFSKIFRFNRAGVRAQSLDIEIFSKFLENFQSVIGPLYRGSTPLKQHFIF